MPPGQQLLRSWPRAIVHVDGDAFFASCEQAVHPEYRGKPVVTGKERGIVAAASYEAKAKGVSRGVPLWGVKKLCPDAIIVPSDYETYSLFSKRMFEIMRRFTSLVEESSIDEGFADLTGLQRPFHASYAVIAQRMKETIEDELGITVSVGLSASKVLAKLGSKFKKPSGFTPIPGRVINDYLKVTPAEAVWGVGPRTAAYCKTLGIHTALDFAQKSESFILRHFSKPHHEIWHELNGRAVYEVTTEEKSTYASISKTKTFTPPSQNPDYVYAQLLKNLENACIKARRYNLVAQGLVLFLKRQDFSHVGLEVKLSRASAYPQDITPLLRQLFQADLYQPGGLYRATGVVLTALRPEAGLQPTLFEPAVQVDRLKRLYEALDSLAERFGKHAVHLAGSSLAHGTPQHVQDRGDVPLRKQHRLSGETQRKHLTIPLLAGRL
jgi:DNA polymerase-4/DNA polymerase V